MATVPPAAAPATRPTPLPPDCSSSLAPGGGEGGSGGDGEGGGGEGGEGGEGDDDGGGGEDGGDGGGGQLPEAQSES